MVPGLNDAVAQILLGDVDGDGVAVVLELILPFVHWVEGFAAVSDGTCH